MRVTGDVVGSGAEIAGPGAGGRTGVGRGPRRVSTVPGRRVRSSGPRPVRPDAVPTATRPSQPARPVPGGARLLVRAPLRPLPPHIRRRRQVAAAIGTVLITAAVVVLLGLLADAVAVARQGTFGPSTPGYSLTGGAPAPGQVSLAPLG